MKNWQRYVALCGSILWLITFLKIETILAFDSYVLTRLSTGYILFFIVAYVGHIIWGTPDGFLRSFFESDNVLANIHAGFLLGFIFLIAGIAFFIGLKGWTTFEFNVGAMIAAFVVSQGVVPFIKEYDRRTGY